MKPKKGDSGSDMEEDLKDPLQLTKELVLLIVEARTPDVSSAKGRVEGPHCPVMRGRVSHKCLADKPECIRASEFCYQTQRLCHNNIPVCLDILFLPRCCHGMQESLVTEGSFATAAQENALLIERWSIECTRKRQDSSLSSSLLLQAVRSYLHFSQISSWLISTQGELPGYLVYRINAPGDEATCGFPSQPDQHNFPMCSAHQSDITVSVLSLKRQSNIPILGCALTDKGRLMSSMGRANGSTAADLHLCTNKKSIECYSGSALGKRNQNNSFTRVKSSGSDSIGDKSWYHRNKLDLEESQEKNSSREKIEHYPHQSGKRYSNKGPQKLQCFKDAEGLKRKGNKVKKKDGEKDERIDQRKLAKAEKFRGHGTLTYNGASSNNSEQLSDDMVDWLMTSKSSLLYDKAVQAETMNYHLYEFENASLATALDKKPAPNYNDFKSLALSKAYEKAYIKDISKRLSCKHHYPKKNNLESSGAVKKFPENCVEMNVPGCYEDQIDGKLTLPSVVGSFSELLVTVPHVYDIFEDSDSTPVPSPNQMTLGNNCDSFLTSGALRRMTSPTNFHSYSTDPSLATQAGHLVSDDSQTFVCLDTIQSGGLLAAGKASTACRDKYYSNGNFELNSGEKPSTSCSRKKFEENPLPLVSYDAGSDSFIQVDLSSQASILHSPKVLLSCDIPHDRSSPQRKCIDFDDDLESQFFKSKLGDVVDASSIGQYLSGLANLSAESETSKEGCSRDNLKTKKVTRRSRRGQNSAKCRLFQVYDDSTSSSESDYFSLGNPTDLNSSAHNIVLESRNSSGTSVSGASSSVSSSFTLTPHNATDQSQSFAHSSNHTLIPAPEKLHTVNYTSSFDGKPSSTISLSKLFCSVQHPDKNLSISPCQGDQTGQQSDQSLGSYIKQDISDSHSNYQHSDSSDPTGNQSSHSVVSCDGHISPQYSSLSSPCDRVDSQSSQPINTSNFSNIGQPMAGKASPAIKDIPKADDTNSYLVCPTHESHPEAVLYKLTGTSRDTTFVPSTLESSSTKSKANQPATTGCVDGTTSDHQENSRLDYLCDKQEGVVFYLQETPATSESSFLSYDLCSSDAADRASSFSFANDLSILSRANFEDSQSLCGSPPLHGDAPGWTSVPPHRTVSTPSCMDREEKAPEPKLIRPSGNNMKKADTLNQIGLRKMTVKSASMIFNSRTGLPTQSSPAPLKRQPGSCFDYDANLLSTRALKNAVSCSKLSVNRNNKGSENEEDRRRALSTSAPASTNCLLGNFEESILNGRIDPVGTVDGFTAEIGASGAFCPKHLHLPVSAFFFSLSDDNAPSPYLGHINLEAVSKKGYHIPKKGTVQVTLFNPSKTVVKMFVVMYDLTDMPVSSQTFIRQRTIYCPTDVGSTAPSYLRYLIHLRCASSRSGKIYLHTDIRLIFARHKLDIDAKNITYELKSFTEGPSNPKYSPKK